ncbi:MAG: hypothetical protein FJY34_11245 [Betaproteobacteria bacterium]|nr:hypothetical protein [Betaproteobacteria bacterium]
MKRIVLLAAALLSTPLAQGQVTTYCKDIGDGKTYCTGGTVIHRHDNTIIVPNAMPAQPYPPQAMPPNPLLQINALPTLNAPYTGAGAQQALPAASAPILVQSVQPAVPAAPVIVVPPAGSGRVCS